MTMLPAQARIVRAGAITSVGYCVPQIWAAVRAGISRASLPGPVDSHMDPIRMSSVDEADLEPLLPENQVIGLTSRQRRMVRLAAPALREATQGLAPAVAPPLYLALPRPGIAGPTPPSLMAAIVKQAGFALDEANSVCFPVGRAGFFLALEQGLRALNERRATTIVVGGVDTHADLRLLASLDREERLLGERVADGFIPGEGAAFLLLERAASNRREPSSFIAGVGVGRDAGHRYAEQPARGEGLWNAMNALFGAAPLGAATIATTFAGWNGESFGAKEWGVARLRHKGCFADDGHLDHPADCYGDLGAATGGMLVALASQALLDRHRTGPALVWASSDHEERGCALVDCDIS